jgi:hypothetical protein
MKSRVDVQMVLSAPAERKSMFGPEAAHKSYRVTTKASQIGIFQDVGVSHQDA